MYVALHNCSQRFINMTLNGGRTAVYRIHMNQHLLPRRHQVPIGSIIQRVEKVQPLGIKVQHLRRHPQRILRIAFPQMTKVCLNRKIGVPCRPIRLINPHIAKKGISRITNGRASLAVTLADRS